MALAATALAFALVAGGCGSASSAYFDVQDTWTRKELAHDGFDTEAYLYATLKTMPFRRAYVDEYSRMFALTGDQKTSLLEAEEAENEASYVVIAAFYTPEVGWNDLDPSRGIWEVRLEGPRGNVTRPHKVTRLNKRNPTWDALYPYTGLHYILYELRFARTDDDGERVANAGEPLKLVVSGAPARIELSWTLPR
ncbi:MAG: hypothetical protein KC635_24315 [Myxococcales bacterium]|nr:hypothetical protein [Myxococcales bacterium]MCB9733083.1 hypothetical protein [Deltaproteobacteria bacterium]